MACSPAAKRRPSASTLFDTLSFAEQWQLTGRLPRRSVRHRFRQRGAHGEHGAQPVLHAGAVRQVDDTLFSYKMGVLFKPVENGSIYLSHATSQAAAGRRQLHAAAPTARPTTSTARSRSHRRQNLELGTKWELRDGALAITGAVFDSTSKNELAQDPADPTRVRADRRARSERRRARHRRQGHRQLGPVSAGIAKMDTEVVRGNPNQTGSQINWSPELTFSSWTTYRTPFGLTIGGGVRYVDTVAPVDQQRGCCPTDQRAVRARILGGGRDGSATRSTTR